MILADKIMDERKKNGWSQEELAVMLDVSRQSVSKWESAQSTPDMTRILKMSEIFGVSTDYLLKDNLEPEQNREIKEEVIMDRKIRKVTMEDANRFLSIEERVTPRIANATSLFILSPVILLTLIGLVEGKYIAITEDMASYIGIIFVLLFVAAGVFIAVRSGALTSEFEYLEKEMIETAYGVDGMVREKKEAFTNKYTTLTAAGVGLCILAVIPLLTAGMLEANDGICVLMVAVLLVVVSIAVNMMVRVGKIKGGYDKLLQIEDYSAEGKKSSGVVGTIASIYWPVAVVIFLAWSFLTNDYQHTWIVWPIAGVLFGGIAAVVSSITKKK